MGLGIVRKKRVMRRHFSVYAINALTCDLILLIYFTILLFIYLAVLDLSCCMQNVGFLWHVGFRTLTRDQTLAPCIGSMKS